MPKLKEFPANGIRLYRDISKQIKFYKRLNSSEKRHLLTMNRRLAIQVHEFVAKDLQNVRPGSLLEIGCEDGKLLARLSKAKGFSGTEFYGIDPSPDSVKKAKKRLRNLVNLRAGKNTHIPYKRKFDLVLACLSFHEWKNGHRSIPYILHRLNEGGSFIIYDTVPIDLKRFRHRSGMAQVIQRNRVLAKITYHSAI